MFKSVMKSFVLFMTAIGFAGTGTQFTVNPALNKISASNWQITFTMDRATDVAVSIINISDSTIVRHLAAGVLGSNAPEPFTKNSLSQTLTWDGKDDNGRTVTIPDANLKARVRAGMSTQLVGLYGGNPYTLGNLGSTWINGIVAGSNGTVFVAGSPAFIHQEHYGQTYATVMQYDKDGNYIKTVFPQPANLSQSEVSGWGVNNWSDGRFTPKNPNTSMPVLTTSIMGSIWHTLGSSLQYIDKDGNIVFGSNKIIAFKQNGAFSGTGKASNLIVSPSIYPASSALGGPFGMTCLTPLPNGKILVSGIFFCTGGNPPSLIPDTGFFRDGQVFISDPATGNIASWLKVDSVPTTSAARLTRLGGGCFYSALQGTAIDSSKRIYVCDRMNQRIGVYDTNAVFLGSIPVRFPSRVAVCGRTGAVYVITQTQAAWAGASLNVAKLIKFAPFNQGGSPVCSTQLASINLGRSGKTSVSYMAVNDFDGVTTVWVGISQGLGVRLFRDGGTQFTKVRDFAEESRTTNELGSENPTPDRLMIDRSTENLYVSDSYWGLYKIENWNNPKLTPCSTNTKKRLYGMDWTISNNNHLYINGGAGTAMNGAYNSPVTRYTLDHLHAAVKWANTDSNQMVGNMYARYAPCSGARGLAIAPDGKMAFMGLLPNRSTYVVGTFPDSGSNVTAFGKVQVGTVSSLSGGVRYDQKGNLYIGSGAHRPSPFAVPDLFLSDTGFKWGMGTVFKFKGTDSGAVLPTGAVNAAKVYNLPLSPFSADRFGGCVCRSPRFELDPYGRMFLPSAITCQVTVADDEGNIIHQFGKYGNLDSRGSLPGLPSQAVISGTEIPMAWPTSVAASEDYIYISDYVNYRIVRAKMVYAADNYPGLTGRSTKSEEAAVWRTPLFTLSSSPVPFNNGTVISLNLPARANITLSVLDAKGQLVRTIDKGNYAQGMHRFGWDGRNDKHLKVAAGLYIYRVVAGSKVLVSKTIITR